jgi:magnesium chelatase family protein
VVYLDEVDQFSRSAMAAVEDREVLMHRGERCTVLPCDVLLVASVADCPCGRGSDTCGCGPSDLQRWRRGVLERAGGVLQIAAALHPPSAEELAAPAATTSFDARTVVAVARERQAERAAATGAALNGRLPAPVRTNHIACEHANALAGLDQPARDRALRVARTIADLADSSAVTDAHLQEAVALTDVAGTLSAARRSAA